jgi:diaminopimelate decarboxylase
MTPKTVPFTKAQLEKIIARYPTPFHIYDEAAMRSNARELKAAFSWAPGFINYFAVKATPNPSILKIMKEEGFGADASSLPELILAERVGLEGGEIMFSSNNTPAEEYVKARELGAIINLDDITHIPFLEKHAGIPELVSCRYNPGPARTGNAIIGRPEEAKYGFTRDQLLEGYADLKRRGAKRFGLHTMVVSNETNHDYLIETSRMLFELVVEISRKVGIRFDLVNLGGGVGVAYRPEQDSVDYVVLSRGIQKHYDAMIRPAGLHPLKVTMENGRRMSAPYGYLIAKVRHFKHIYKEYAGLDACMANLMRPALYGAYHHITVMGKENAPRDHRYDVTGSLCENNDKFAIDRMLPALEIGDIVVIHDAGAHGHAMGFNYNGKLRSAELLLKPDGSVEQIRRQETMDDYFATLDFSLL